MKKNKEYYIQLAKKKWEEVLLDEIKEFEEEGFVKSEKEEGLWIHPTLNKKVHPADTATETYDSVLNAEEVVGYYLWLHEENALRDWQENTARIQFTEQDKEVDRILKELYNITD